MRDFIPLTQEELNLIQKYNNEINKIKELIGILRLQYLKSENDLFLKLNNNESELMNYLKILAKDRNKEDNEEWIFDLNKGGFVINAKNSG